MPELVNTYGSWVQKMLREYDEIPFGYTEWTMTGHLAIAAAELGYYVLQEYSIKPGINRDEASKRLRADLYLRTHRRDYVFEVKQVYLRLGDSKSAMETAVNKKLRQARDKLYRYRGQAKYRCSIVVGAIDIETKKQNDWEDRYHIRESYSEAKEELRDNLDSLFRTTLPSSMVNYCGGFLCTYPEARNEYRKGHREGWNPIVGFVFLGRVIRPRHRGR